MKPNDGGDEKCIPEKTAKIDFWNPVKAEKSSNSIVWYFVFDTVNSIDEADIATEINGANGFIFYEGKYYKLDRIVSKNDLMCNQSHVEIYAKKVA